MNGNPPSELRILRKFLDTSWKRVWLNLNTCAAPDAIKSTWYTAIHGLIPTNDRLASINQNATAACSSCGLNDSLQYRITGCGEGPIIWTCTKKILGVILRMDQRYIPQDWTILPAIQYWPAQKQAAILWILARLVHYRLQTHSRLSLLDYMVFLWLARCKLYRKYLDVLDWPQPWCDSCFGCHTPSLCCIQFHSSDLWTPPPPVTPLCAVILSSLYKA